MKTITVIGAGNSGLAMAGHLAAEGYAVQLWNRSYNTIKPFIADRIIEVTGVINQKVKLAMVTQSMKEAVKESDLILVTTPANAHKDIAQELAPFASDEMKVLLNPGRTFGAIEFSDILRKSGCKLSPLIAEAQTIIYTCRKSSPQCVSILQFKKDVLFSCLDSGQNAQFKQDLPKCISDSLVAANSIVETSIGNVGMILHCVPVLLNCGWIESPKTHFKYYYEGITPSVAGLLEQLDNERMAVAAKLGHPVESTQAWLKRSYAVEGNNLYECIQNNEAYRTIDAPSSLHHRYIFEDVNCGLVPLEAMGISLGLSMRICGIIINLASAILGVDFRKTGRKARLQ